jgi:hypothetical protein
LRRLVDNQEKIEESFTPQELNLIIDSLGRNYRRLTEVRQQARSYTAAEIHTLSTEMEDLRVLHLRLVKSKRVIR